MVVTRLPESYALRVHQARSRAGKGHPMTQFKPVICRRPTLLKIAALAFATSGCASLDGAPKPIMSVADSVRIAQRHKISVAIENFHGASNTKRNSLSPLRYRNMIVAVYLNAIDARYQQFRKHISGEGRGVAIGTDLAVIGLTTGASLIEKSSKDLAAIAAAFAGGKGTIDKNLYFERTMPAILAAMDAERAKVRAGIVANLKKDVSEYPIETAFGDIAAYEAAATIDRAIDMITAQASKAREIQTVSLDSVVRACSKPVNLEVNRRRLAKFADSLAATNKVEELKTLAGMTDVPVEALGTATAQDIAFAIQDSLRDGPCTVAELDEIINEIKLQSWGSAI
jgi:hypothetical protein